MNFIALVFKEKYRVLAILVILGLITGFIQVGLLMFINKAIASLVKSGSITFQVFIEVTILLICYPIVNLLLSKRVIRFSQKVIHDLRLRLMRSVLGASYLYMKERDEQITSAVTKDTVSVSRAALLAIHFITSMVTVLGCLVYLALLSFTALMLITFIILIGVSIHWIGTGKNNMLLKKGRESEDILFHHVKELIDGFREVKINLDKGKTLIEGPLQESSLENYSLTSDGYIGYYKSNMISQFLFYIALFTLLFLGHSWFDISPTILVNCIIITLYVLGPIEIIMTTIPELGAGNIAALRLQEILASFENKTVYPAIFKKDDFEKLALESIKFNFNVKGESSNSLFVLGPVNLTITKGDVLFIYGGNGSGKTTLFHIIMGLIKSDSGNITLNGTPLKHDQEVFNLFAPVFSDFHLFDKLYGIENLDRQRTERYLKLFELDDKVTLEIDKFSSTALSTGQRKRLALIAALLEDRPLLFLDEWAADQDPAFRKKFYESIIPIIKAEGFTIVAITHDDMYYHTSDALYRMEYGQLLKERIGVVFDPASGN